MGSGVEVEHGQFGAIGTVSDRKRRTRRKGSETRSPSSSNGHSTHGHGTHGPGTRSHHVWSQHVANKPKPRAMTHPCGRRLCGPSRGLPSKKDKQTHQQTEEDRTERTRGKVGGVEAQSQSQHRHSTGTVTAQSQHITGTVTAQARHSHSTYRHC